jgi:hypothetical protein
MVNVLYGVARSRAAPEAARVAAAAHLLDRGWGKPPQAHTGEDGGDITIVIRTIIEGADRSMKEVPAAQPQLTFDNDKDDG